MFKEVKETLAAICYFVGYLIAIIAIAPLLIYMGKWWFGVLGVGL